MATLTAAQIEQKKQLLAEKEKQMKAIYDQLVEQREQSDACIDSAESRQKKTEGQLVEAGAIELSDDDLDQAAGGYGESNYPPKDILTKYDPIVPVAPL